MTRLTAIEALEQLIETLGLGYSEGPIATSSGGAVAVVFHDPIDQEKLQTFQVDGWKFSQRLTDKGLLLGATAEKKRRRVDASKLSDPEPGDIVIIGKTSWALYRPDLLKIEPGYWWLRLTGYRRGETWTFLRARSDVPIVVETPAGSREADPILKRHLQWAQESTNWQEFLKKFDS